MSRRRTSSSTSDEDIQIADGDDIDLLDDEDGHDILLGSRLEEELNYSIERMREEEAVPIARLIRLEGSLGSSSQGSSQNSPHIGVVESATSQLNGTLELLEDVEMPSLSLCESAELVSLLSISPSSPVKLGFSFRTEGQVDGTFVAEKKRENVFSVSSSFYRKPPPPEDCDIAEKIAMLSAVPAESTVNTLITFDEKEVAEKEPRRMTLEHTKSFSGAFLAEACGIVDELDGLAANMTSSPIVSPERVSPGRKMTLGPDLDLLDMENMNDSLLSSLAIAKSPVRKIAAAATTVPSSTEMKKVELLPASVKPVDCTYDRLARLLNETQDVIAAPAAVEKAICTEAGPANSTFVQNNQQVLNTTFDGEQAHLIANKVKLLPANTTFDQKQMTMPTNKITEKMEQMACANTTFEMKEENPVNTTFDRKENLQANSTFELQTAPETKSDNLNVTFEKGEYRIHSLNETVNLMDAEGDVLKLILDSTPKKAGKVVPDAASTPKGTAKPPQMNSKGTITKDPTQSFLHRMSLGVRKEETKNSGSEGQLPAGEFVNGAPTIGSRPTVPGFRMGLLDQQAMSNQLRRLHNAPTVARNIAGPMRALPLQALPVQQLCGRQMEGVHTPDDNEGITPLDNNTPAEPAIKDFKPSFGSFSSIENERPGTPDLGIEIRSSTPDVFRPGDPVSGPRITSTPAMRGGVFSRMVGMDGPAPTPIAAPVSRLQRVISIASTGSLPEMGQSEDPIWPGLSQDSTKGSKGIPGTPANHGSERSLKALKMAHRTLDKPLAEANEAGTQDMNCEPLNQDEDLAISLSSVPKIEEIAVRKTCSSLPTTTIQECVLSNTFGHSQETGHQVELNEDLYVAKELELVKRDCAVVESENMKADCLEEVSKANDILSVPGISEDQALLPVDDLQPVVDFEHANALIETQVVTYPTVNSVDHFNRTTDVLTPAESVLASEITRDIEDCKSDYQKMPEQIGNKNKDSSNIQHEIEHAENYICLKTTSDPKNEPVNDTKDNIENHKNVLDLSHEQEHDMTKKAKCIEENTSHNSQENTVHKQKRNISTESSESSSSAASSEVNIESRKQTKAKRMSLTQVRKSTPNATLGKTHVEGKEKLNTSRKSTGNTRFSKTVQQTSTKIVPSLKAGIQLSKTQPDLKKQQLAVKPTPGLRRSLLLSSSSEGSNKSLTRSNKENVASKEVGGSAKQTEVKTKPLESQVKSRQSLLPAGKNVMQRPVLGPSNIQIRKSNVQIEKPKTSLQFAKKSAISTVDNEKKNGKTDFKNIRPKVVQSGPTESQDSKGRSTHQGGLKPPNKRMKASSPSKSPQKFEPKGVTPEQAQGASKRGVGTFGIPSKLTRPQSAGLQPPSAAKILSGPSNVSKLPGLRPPSNVRTVAGRKVSGIMAPGVTKPSALRAPRPVAQ